MRIGSTWWPSMAGGIGVGVDQHRVRPAVIMALELDDLAPPGERRAQRRKAAIAASVPVLAKRTLSACGRSFDQHLRHLDLDLEGGGEMRAARDFAA